MDEVKRGRPAKMSAEPEAVDAGALKPIALEIVCDAKDKEKAAEIAYMENMDAKGGVLLANPVCGGSAYIKDFETFPRVNMRCTCGQVGHFMVKYTFNK